MIPQMLRHLCGLLPCVGEEGSSFGMAEEELHAALLERFPECGRDIETCLTFVRLLFGGTGVLDPECLERGEWRFVSYAARTAAVSMLRLLPRPAGEGFFSQAFWTDGECAKDRRRLLERMAEHLAKDAEEPAVRISHVSFALIRCGELFLCHERELDKNDPDRVKRGDLVLPGGRLDIRDMPPSFSRKEKLRLLFRPEGLGRHAVQAHEHALRRELQEELGLRPDMYDIAEFARFRPYRGCHGGGDKHAWTDTSIWLYEVTMHPEAAAVLQPCFDRRHAGCWACAEELWQSRSRMGERIFFDACRENLSAEALAHARDSFPFLQGSSGTPMCMLLSGDASLSVSVAPCREEGRAGRPKSSRAVTLNEEQSQLLLALALARRSMAWPREREREEQRLSLRQDRPEECLAALGGLLLNSAELRRLYASLPGDILDCCSTGARYFRLCADVYFPTTFFSYSLADDDRQKRTRLVIHRKRMDLPLLGLQCPELRLECDLAEGPMDIFRGVRREGGHDTLRTARDRLSDRRLEDRARDIGLFRIYDNNGIITIPGRRPD